MAKRYVEVVVEQHYVKYIEGDNENEVRDNAYEMITERGFDGWELSDENIQYLTLTTNRGVRNEIHLVCDKYS